MKELVCPHVFCPYEKYLQIKLGNIKFMLKKYVALQDLVTI